MLVELARCEIEAISRGEYGSRVADGIVGKSLISEKPI